MHHLELLNVCVYTDAQRYLCARTPVQKYNKGKKVCFTVAPLHIGDQDIQQRSYLSERE